MNSSYNINIKLDLGERSDEEIAEIIAEDIEIKMGEMFRIVGFINVMLEQSLVEPALAYGCIETLAEIGVALSSSRDNALTDYKRNLKAQNKAVLDLSSQTTVEGECVDLAKHISAILKDERAPLISAAIITQIQTDYPEMTHFTVDNLSKILCDEVKDEKDS